MVPQQEKQRPEDIATIVTVSPTSVKAFAR
jgi:hypothetical protein